jgi:hypothetical protein
MVSARTAGSRALLGLIAALTHASVGCSPDETGGMKGGQTTVVFAGTFAAPIPSTAGRAGTGAAAGSGSVLPRPAAAGSSAIAAPGAAGRPAGVAGAAAPAPSGAAGARAPGAPAVPGAPAIPGAPAVMPGAPVPVPVPAPGAGIPPATGESPVLPAIMGECPELKSGTIMAAGHGSIVLQVGEANKGGPLLFYWHGTGSSAAEGGRFPGNAEIVAAGGIVAAFNGNASSGGGDCSGTGAHGRNDFKAADQIAACAVKNHGIDARRFYTTGCSAGGLQSGCMAQMRSSYVAAAAPNSGGIVSPQAWQDKHSPAIFTMHGGSSDVVIVTFSQTSATLDMNTKNHGSFVVNCNHGGGHCAAPADLQKAAWQFMKDHPWGTTPMTSPWAKGIPAGVPAYCKIF